MAPDALESRLAHKRVSVWEQGDAKNHSNAGQSVARHWRDVGPFLWQRNGIDPTPLATLGAFDPR